LRSRAAARRSRTDVEWNARALTPVQRRSSAHSGHSPPEDPIVMKLLLLPVLLVGAGWYGLCARADDPRTAPAAKLACDPTNCHVSVECTDHATCIVTCSDDDGSVLCREEVPCDGPCAPGATKPCESEQPLPCCSSKPSTR